MTGGSALRIGLAAALLAGPALAGDAPGAGSSEATGKRVYAERCAPCHGDDGGGDGPAAAALEPRPRNFRDAEFWKGRATAQLRAVVRQGKPGTMMQPFEGVLSDDEIDAVVTYVERFRPTAGIGPRPGDGQVSFARIGQDQAGSRDRSDGGGAPVRGIRP